MDTWRKKRYMSVFPLHRYPFFNIYIKKTLDRDLWYLQNWKWRIPSCFLCSQKFPNVPINSHIFFAKNNLVCPQIVISLEHSFFYRRTLCDQPPYFNNCNVMMNVHSTTTSWSKLGTYGGYSHLGELNS